MDNLSKTPISTRENITILSLSAESAGNFSIYKNGMIYSSKNFGDLLNENNFVKFQKAVLDFLKTEKIKPSIILTDLHPEMKTTLWGSELAKKLTSKHIKIQHHHAHIFSQIVDQDILNTKYQILNTVYGVTLDGTGYGLDAKIWGGEVFALQRTKNEEQIHRIGHLENQTMIGGDLAIREPARMLISILSKINFNPTPPNSHIPTTPILRSMGVVSKSNLSKSDFGKKLAYPFVKKYYSKNQFELLYNQLQQNFNCQETSSTGRILDATAVLLGVAKNERKYKHQASDLLEKKSTKPYLNLKPKIIKSQNSESRIQNSKFILDTTYLFEYLIKNLHRDKRRLAATAQFYIAQGMYEIIKSHQVERSEIRLGRVERSEIRLGRVERSEIRPESEKRKMKSEKLSKAKSALKAKSKKIKVKSEKCRILDTRYETPDTGHQTSYTVLSGGISENKIISNYFQSKGTLINKKPVVARGDAGLSVGQIICFLFKE